MRPDYIMGLGCLSKFVFLTCFTGCSNLQCKQISDVFDVALALVIY